MFRYISIAALILFSAVAQAAPVTVSFSGTLDMFNTGPFAAGTTFSGTFELDSSVAVSPVNRFPGAVDNLQLNIGGNLFSANNGDLQQVDLIVGRALMFSFPVGTTSGSYNGYDFERMSFELRGPDLLSDVSQMLSTNLTTSDFTYITANFDFGGVLDWVLAGGHEFNSVTVNAVPIPASLFLFAPSLLGLLGLSARRRKSDI